MSGALENRSSLRKLEFPNCTIEALKRLHSTCVTVSHKLPVLDSKMATNPAAFLVLAPKETELVLDIIDEFVFFTKSSISKSRRLTSQVQELQLLQIIIDFYRDILNEHGVPESLDLNESTGPLLLLTNYLFMDSDPKVDKRSLWYSRFTILALSLKNRPVLHCVGLWLFQQQCSNVLALQLTESIVNTYVSLVHDSQENLNNMPNISPIFAVGFMTCLTELYSTANKWPSIALVEIITHWMESRDQLMNILGSALLVGLARWTILYPLTGAKNRSSKDDATYAQLHLSILETLADSKKGYSVPSKTLVLLVGKVEETLRKYDAQCDLGSNKELALDRLGQFLHCLTATGGIHGKVSEIFSSVKRIQESNRLLQMYVNRGQ